MHKQRFSISFAQFGYKASGHFLLHCVPQKPLELTFRGILQLSSLSTTAVTSSDF